MNQPINNPAAFLNKNFATPMKNFVSSLAKPKVAPSTTAVSTPMGGSPSIFGPQLQQTPQFTPLPVPTQPSAQAPAFSTSRAIPQVAQQTPPTAQVSAPTAIPTPVTQPQTTFTTPSGAVVDASGNLITPPGAPQAPSERPAIPETPQVPPETQSAVTSAEKAFAEASKISPEELSTQADIDKLVESTNKAFLNTSNQPIPLEFITGQLKSIEQRALGLAEPLEAKLSRLQASRQASLSASSFALERADKRAAAETAKDTARVSTDTFIDEFGDVILFNTETGAEIRNLGPEFKEDAARAADFTLSPGQVRFDEFGNVVATGAEKPLSPEQEIKAQEKTEAATAAKSEVLNNLNLVNRLLESNTDVITGLKGPSAFIPGTEAQGTKNLFNQVKGILSIDRRSKMQGSGAISDFEAKTLSESASAIDTNLSNEAFTFELKQIRGVFSTASGADAPVIVTDPTTGEEIEATVSREEIDALISEGNIVKYN